MQLPLPGRTAHWRMGSSFARNLQRASSADNALLASVLVLFYPVDNEPHIVLIKRESGVGADKHRGQVAFPGGKLEPSDADLSMAALRESHEEIGVSPHEVRLLGALTPLYIPVSNFLVHPFVGVAEQRPNFFPDPSEVAYIIETPLAALQDKRNRKMKEMTLGNGFVLPDVPYFDIQNETVWGATAMILSELLEMVPSNNTLV